MATNPGIVRLVGLLLLFAVCSQTNGLARARLKITLTAFQNPGGITSIGSCCESFQRLCPNSYTSFVRNCDTYFVITVLESSAHGNTFIGRYTTQVWEDERNVTFGRSLGNGIANPIIITRPLWNYQRGYILHIVVSDRDGSNDDKIAEWSQRWNRPVGQESALTLNSRDSISLKLKISSQCLTGFYGTSCRTYCVSRSSYTCHPVSGRKICRLGYGGGNCSPIDECQSNPCRNDGNCIDSHNSFRCRCAAGFQGTVCQYENCLNKNCHNGSCVEELNRAYCRCNNGFTGPTCNENINECVGITCSYRGTCLDGINGYQCQCEDGFTGKNCEINIDDCSGVICSNHGTCVDQISSYRCRCTDGFAGDNCEINIDDCSGITCSNHGTCIDQLNSYRCRCFNGFTGTNCEININECSGITCSNHGNCVDQINGYHCNCADGFGGDNCEINIDDCSGVTCYNHGICVDQINSYHCRCTHGFIGNNCEINIDDCFGVTCSNRGTCVDLVNDYRCHCVNGFTGDNCEINIDDCSNVTCSNRGTCEDEINGYRCRCIDGFTGDDCEVNIDDCSGVTCSNRGTCADEIGGYRCHCTDGFTGDNCEVNIDDCSGVTCANRGTCVDQIDGYRCQCTNGFTGDNCEINIDDCLGVSCSDHGTCIDQVNGYQCHCADGFAGDSCEISIDDCSDVSCSNRGTCVDKTNSYRCHCTNGFTGDNCEIDIDDCSNVTCSNGGVCIDQINGFRCQCSVGFTGGNCEINIDDCSRVTCSNRGSCIDEVNGYRCHCTNGFAGDNCEIDIDDCQPDPCNGDQCIDLINGYECKPDDKCVENDQVTFQLAVSFCAQQLDKSTQKCATAIALLTTNTSDVSSACFSLHSFKCSSLEFEASWIETNHSAQQANSFVCNRKIDSSLLCVKSNRSSENGITYCIFENHDEKVHVIVSSKLLELLEKYWYWVIVGCLLIIAMIFVTVLCLWFTRKRKHKCRGRRNPRLPNIPYENPHNHVYEGIIYNNATFDMLPPPPTQEELNNAACRLVGQRSKNEFKYPVSGDDSFEASGRCDKGPYYTEAMGSTSFTNEGPVYATPATPPPSPPPLPAPPFAALHNFPTLPMPTSLSSQDQQKITGDKVTPYLSSQQFYSHPSSWTYLEPTSTTPTSVCTFKFDDTMYTSSNHNQPSNPSSPNEVQSFAYDRKELYTRNPLYSKNTESNTVPMSAGNRRNPLYSIEENRDSTGSASSLREDNEGGCNTSKLYVDLAEPSTSKQKTNPLYSCEHEKKKPRKKQTRKR